MIALPIELICDDSIWSVMDTPLIPIDIQDFVLSNDRSIMKRLSMINRTEEIEC
jgi:hypothetical protein